MAAILEFVLLVVGIVLSVFTFNEILLPLLYGFPRVLSLTLRRYLMWRTPFFYLLSPTLWVLILTGIVSGLAGFASEFSLYLTGSVGFRTGLVSGIIFPIGKLFIAKSARFQVDAQLYDSIRGYATRKGASSLATIILGW